VITPVDQVSPLNLTDRGRLLEISGISAVANLKRNIATRQRRQVIGRLGRRYPLNDIRIHELAAPSPGTYILLLATYEHSHCCYFALGQKGKAAEKVADETAAAFEAFAATDAVVDEFLADQILLPLAFAEGVSEFTTSQVTKHLVTNANVIQAFLNLEINIAGAVGKPGRIRIGSAN
jgi:RNA 3'-terminal phosphate cyclase (ATP)